WIIVLLVTVQYGLRESLAAAVLASVFLLAGNLPEQTMTENLYDYILRVFSQPLLWLITAMILGGIRERQLSEKQGLIDGLRKFEEAMTVIVDGYKALKCSKERLEMRLSEEQCSLLAVYDIAKSLETLDPKQAMTAVETLVRTTLNPLKFSLFVLEENDLLLKAAYGWSEEDQNRY